MRVSWLLAGLVAITTSLAAADEKPHSLPSSNVAVESVAVSTTTPDGKSDQRERLLYLAHHVSAADLMNTIVAVFNANLDKSDTSFVSAATDTASNSILFSATRQRLDEIAKLVAQLDRQPKVVSIDVWIVYLQPDAVKNAENEGKGNSGGLVLSLPASRNKVSEQLAKLEKTEQAIVINQYQLTTLEGREAFIQQGEHKPMVAATNITTTGRVSTVVMENVGTILKVKPRISGDDRITLDLDLEKSFFAPDGTGVVISKSAAGEEVRRPSSLSLVGKTTVNVASGEVVRASGLKSNPAETAGSCQILVSAEVVPDRPEVK